MTPAEFIHELQQTRQRLGLDALAATAGDVTVRVDDERVLVARAGDDLVPVDLDALRYEVA